MNVTTAGRISAPNVHSTIAKHLIADGFPVVFDLERSSGSWIVDARDGARYLDLYSFFASLPLGFNHAAFKRPEVRERLLTASFHKPANSDAETAELASFVESFAALARPEPFAHLFFVEGGALAVENGLKIAFDWKVRKNVAAGRQPLGTRILHFREAFHGRSGYTLSLTNTSPIKTAYYPKFDWPRVTNPKLRFPVDEAEIKRVQTVEADCAEEIREAFAETPHDIAAIIIEPIQGEGGDNHFRREFFHHLRDLADENGALLIMDEVQTGFGSTGRFWAFEHFDVLPDIVCFGKKSQVCGVLAGPRIDEVPENVFKVSSRINSTWGGNLVDMVRCQIILDVMQEENLVENSASVGKHLLGQLQDLTGEFGGKILNPRGRGLMCAFDCLDTAARDAFLKNALEHHVLVLPCGAKSVRMRPALTFSTEDADEAVKRLREVARKTFA